MLQEGATIDRGTAPHTLSKVVGDSEIINESMEDIGTEKRREPTRWQRSRYEPGIWTGRYGDCRVSKFVISILFGGEA